MKFRFPLPRLPLVLFAGLTIALSSSMAAEPKKKADRTSNRGPQEVDLKFKLPPPPVLTPAEAAKAIKLPKGFKIECIASEPMIESPVAMSWDDQGRLYVCEMRGYMNDANAKGEDQPLGRISRLEDVDGDGIMDKATVFVDKLIMPRSITAFGDGVIVAEPPNLIWYHDTKGTGVSDKSEVIADNFGTKGGQPEHMANSLTFMQDNWLWGSAYAQWLRFVKGKFVSEPVRSGGQWGLTQDDWGRRYFNYNSDFLRADLLPPSVYARNPNLADKLALNWQVMKDQRCFSPVPTPGVNRGYTEGKRQSDGTMSDGQLRSNGTLATCTGTCGPVIYRGDLFPKEFQSNVFIPEPCGNLVKRLILSETGGVVTAKNAYPASEFLTSTDERFRPVNAYNGPDGALYLVDMARGIVQHKFFLTHYLIANIEARKLETPVNLGRIWRIVPDKGKDSVRPKAVKLPKETAALVPFLDHPNGHVRDTAQRLLLERADVSVIDAVKKLTVEGKTPQGRVQALWTLEGLGPLMPDVITPCLKDKHEKVRAAAVRLAGIGNIPDLMNMQSDPSAEVRVQLALQLSAQSGPVAQAAVLKLLKTGGSPLLTDAIASGGRGHELEYLEELLKDPGGKNDALAKSGLLKMLAGCVMSERRDARVTKLLELTAAQAPDSPRQLALVQGIIGIPSDGKSKTQPRKLLYLDAQPAALAALNTKAHTVMKMRVLIADGTKKSYMELVDGAIAWPNKPGVPPPPVIVPLTAEQQKRFDHGKMIYGGLCAACHQPTGLGLEGLAPPLVDSEWVLGPADRVTRIILHGLGGPVNVGGRTWRLEMPPLPQFTDEDIASIQTYIRREWEHNASPVTPEEVAKIRAADAGRTKAWTAEELNPPKKKK
ncbi:MAG: c-type cytochrome [Prosthecobacter sp.]|nr:c-type cytochrome [Prosthecobacter sp.]